uniref:Activin_recp domain-containing protein n=1 Tax=Parastrongyloides trichosuri TaxID=131310 RepID=A0A0N4Z6Z6_PARTI
MKLYFSILILLTLDNIVVESEGENDNENLKINLDNHILKDPSTFHYKEPKKIRCFECHSTGNSTWFSSCTKKRFCTGLWCVKGPDDGGYFRGCMDALPFLDHKEKCITYKDSNGIIKQNCYCNEEFCNSSNSLTLSCLFIVSSLFAIFRYLL